MPPFDINYPAVGVAAAVTIVIGALWYSPLLFGNMSMAAHGYSEETVEQMRQAAGKTFLVSFLCYVVMAAVLAVLISYTGVSTVPQGVLLGALIWLGFLATVGLTAHLVSTKPLAVFLIDAGYQLVYLLVMSAILTAWR